MTNKYNILIVDDEDFILAEIESSLPKQQINSVYKASNGQEAWEFFQNNPVDFIISDYQMPVLSGIELLKLVKEHSPEIPFFLMTASSNSEIFKQGIRAGVTEILEKPVPEEEVANILDKMICLSENLKMVEEHTCDNVIPPNVFEAYLKNKQQIVQGKQPVGIRKKSKSLA